MTKNKKTMTEAQRELVTDADVLNFIRKEANIRGKKHPSIGEDEFYSIGLETACVRAMFMPEDEISFLQYIKKYVLGEMNQKIRRDIYGIRQDNNEVTYFEMVMLEELNIGKSDNEDDDRSDDEKLSTMVQDMDEERCTKWAILQPLLERLTAEEREIVLIRYGFFDNHGDAAREYMRKHKIGKTTFYSRAEAAVMKMRKFAQEKND